MGRSFKNEIELLPQTIDWSLKELDISNAVKIIKFLNNRNILVVGSGGSYSAASYIAKLHEYSTGQLSKALTPLEFSYLENAIFF